MSDASQPQADRPRSPRWMKVLLVLSLSVNLLIVGAVVGAVLSGGGKWRGPGAEVRNAGGGAILQALSPEDKRALRRTMSVTLVSDRDMRGALKAEQRELIVLMRSAEFDADAVTAQLQAVQAQMVSHFDVARMVLAQRMVEFDAEERAAYADRLEQILEKRGRKQKQ